MSHATLVVTRGITPVTVKALPSLFCPFKIKKKFKGLFNMPPSATSLWLSYGSNMPPMTLPKVSTKLSTTSIVGPISVAPDGVGSSESVHVSRQCRSMVHLGTPLAAEASFNLKCTWRLESSTERYTPMARALPAHQCMFVDADGRLWSLALGTTSWHRLAGCRPPWINTIWGGRGEV